MDRITAIKKARYFRIGATVIDVDTGRETTYEGTITGSRIDGTKDYADFHGQRHVGPRYRRTTERGPSIAATKRATRGMNAVVVAEQPGENLRRYLPKREEAA